jgi:zinc transport system substrate-binding protein
MIIQEITGSDVECILPNGASPHTYTPKPSDALKVAKASAFFFASKNLDGWAEKMDSKNTIELIRLIPKSLLVEKSKFGDNHDDHDHGEAENDDSFNYEEYDSHFWTDPLTVKALLPMLVQKLAEIHPENSELYKKNSDSFKEELDKLDSEVSIITENIKTKSIFLFHPSFLYFINRFGLTYGGSIEWNPGQENTPNSLANLINLIKSANVKSIFSEPQLSDKAAKVLAEQTGTKVFMMDPLGGTSGRKKYRDFILYNANTLKEALE